jgi:hypothetical protein
MPVDFRVLSFRIEGDDEEEDSDEARFDSEVNRAQVAIQSFHLDFPGTPAPEMNVVKVAASADPPAGREVNVNLSTSYAGKEKGVEYVARVRVLVIADVKVEPT